MKITILSHNLSSNASMRAHRLALAARHFAEVQLIGPGEKTGLWPALPAADWIQSVPECRFPKFAGSFLKLVELCQGDVLIAVKPQLGSFGAALVAAEQQLKPVILDLDDLDTAFAPREEWAAKPAMADLRRPGSAVFVSLLTRATSAAQAITVSSTALQRRFGGTLVHQGCATELFDPTRIDRAAARREFGFTGPTVLFVGTPRWHKGLRPLAKAVAKIPGARLAVASRDTDLKEKDWARFPIDRIPMLPYGEVPRLIAAADVVAIPQMDAEISRFQMPMKAYDCMAMGVPIVASAISDLPQVLEGCACLVPPGDAKALTAALQEILGNPKQAAAMAERACEVSPELHHGEGGGDLARRGASGDGGKEPSMTIAPAEQTGFDPAMPLLAAALDGDRARAVISAALHRWRRDLADVELREVRLVRHKPGRRALIEYQVSFTGADGTELLTLLGKMRAKGLDRRTPALMTQLRRAVFAADSADGASVPEVIGDVPELAFWLQRKVPGRSLADWPAGDEGIRLARRVAEAAAKLHRAAVPTTRRHTVDDELRILRERFDLLATQRPALGGRLSALFAACMELGGSLRFRPTSGTHRDFHPAQVLADGDRLWLLDFDLFCAGDPALDLGNFLGHLTERAVRDPACAKALAKIGRALESRFLELAGEDSRAAVQIWETLTLARHVSISAQFSERRPFTETLLALCETRLGLP